MNYCVVNDCAGEGNISPCCWDCKDDLCPERCRKTSRDTCVGYSKGENEDGDD